VEVMGHGRYAGLVSESTQFGPPLVRVEVPETDGAPAFEKYFTSGAIYSITPCDEPLARKAAMEFASRPITVVELASFVRQAIAHEGDYSDDLF